MYVDWGLAGAVILSGLVIVFIILIVLIWIVMVTGKLVKPAYTAKPAETPPAMRTQAPAAPVIQSGIDEETVAVISAAVYSCLEATGDDVRYAIKSISRSTGARPVWGFAGMRHNTRPF